MRLLRTIIVGLAVLLAAGTALADDPSGVFDPVQATNILGFNLVESATATYEVSWTGCGIAQLLNYNAYQNASACLYFVNLTGAPLTTFSFQFEDTGIPGPFSCLSADSQLSQCTTTVTGDIVTMNFYGGNPIPYTSPIPTIFILGLVGDDAEGNPISPTEANNDLVAAAGVTVPANDPGTLVLLVGSIGLMGLCGLRRRTA